MPIAQWDDSLRTGHQMVDQQHKELFRMVNNLHDAMATGQGKEVLGPTLEELARYTVGHFRAEESLMASTQYPHLEAHRSQHVALTRQVSGLLVEFRSGKSVLTVRVASFLADWLRHHIREEDMAFVQHTQGKAKGAAAGL